MARGTEPERTRRQPARGRRAGARGRQYRRLGHHPPACRRPRASSTVAEPRPSRLRPATRVAAPARGRRTDLGQTPRTWRQRSASRPRAHGLFSDGSGVGLDDELAVDDAVAGRPAWRPGPGRRGAARVRPGRQEPVLWPEHFDVGHHRGRGELRRRPPATASTRSPTRTSAPWQVPAADEFWDAPFGAARALDSLGTAEAVRRFFAEGRARASERPAARLRTSSAAPSRRARRRGVA